MEDQKRKRDDPTESNEEKKRKRKEEEEKEPCLDAGNTLRQEEENDQLQLKAGHTFSLEQREARKRAKEKVVELKKRMAKKKKQRIPPAVGKGEWYPTKKEWRCAVVNARWREEMEKMGRTYHTEHMSLQQLKEWKIFFKTTYNCEPWEFEHLRFDNNGQVIGMDDPDERKVTGG